MTKINRAPDPHNGSRTRPLLLGGAAALLLLSVTQGGIAQDQGKEAAGSGQEIAFLHPLDDSPLDVPLPEGDKLTEAVAQFHETGQNIHVGNPEAVAEGKKLYQKLCQSCHLGDATGRIGPNLIDDEYRYPRVASDVGLFEVIYAGAAGAMQAFAKRMSQDEILETIAYLRSLQKES